MLESLVALARWARRTLYEISRLRLGGLDVDVVLHFGLGALIFGWAERRMGARRAALLLGALILAKEVADLFLKSSIQYIRRPTLPIVLDIVTDIATGVAGGLTVHLVRKARRRQRRERQRRERAAG
jgi:hypothetical protein